MSAPLRIGVLGASRIAELAVIDAARQTGDALVVVAARDPERARAYADARGFASWSDSYAEVVGDASLDLVYVGLPNGLHAEWAARALDAGRNVLVEKPFAANLAEFDRVASRLGRAPGWAWEAFHYADHPGMQRLIEVARSGEIGRITGIDVHMDMPAPDAGDPRWSFDLAGGALMDLGCYAINALLLLGERLGARLGEDPGEDPAAEPGAAAEPAGLTLTSAQAEPAAADPRVDAAVVASLDLGGVPAAVHTSMVSSDWDFGLRVIGSRGEVVLPNFVKPQEDGRLIVRADEGERVEDLGSISSYTYQLRRIAAAVRAGAGAHAGADVRAELARSRCTMQLIDEIYTASGLPLRPGRLTD